MCTHMKKKKKVALFDLALIPEGIPLKGSAHIF